MKFANKLTAKAMLAVALLGVGGATISAVQHRQVIMSHTQTLQ